MAFIFAVACSGQPELLSPWATRPMMFSVQVAIASFDVPAYGFPLTLLMTRPGAHWLICRQFNL